MSPQISKFADFLPQSFADFNGWKMLYKGSDSFKTQIFVLITSEVNIALDVQYIQIQFLNMAFGYSEDATNHNLDAGLLKYK